MVLKNIVLAVKLAKTFGLPIVHSTVNVSSGRRKPTASELEESPPIDRTTIYAWEDADVLAAGWRKLVLSALWTEMCMACKWFLSERIQQNF